MRYTRMSICTYAGGNLLFGVTPVDNLFLSEYMGTAPREYVPVYLYGLMLCNHPEVNGGIDEIASALKLDSSAVLNAFKYWEREGLVEQLSENPPAFNYLPLSPANAASGDRESAEVYQYKDYFRELQAMMPSLVLEGHELRMASEWVDELHLSQEAALYMVSVEVRRRGGKLPTAHTLFKHLNETALEMAEANVADLNSAEEFLALKSADADCARAVCKQFSFRRNPTVDEVALATKWMEEWKLTVNDVVDACAETVKSGNPSFAYLDRILEGRISGNSDDEFKAVKTLCTHLGITSRPTPTQTEAYRGFMEMGFEPAAIEQAAIWCGENNRRTFEDIASKLSVWAKAGADTVEDIERERAEQAKIIEFLKKVFDEAAVDRRITQSDIKLAKVWTALVEPDAVLFAASFARGSMNAMQYINKIVQEWSFKGINTLEKAKAAGIQKPAGEKKTGKPMDTRTVTEEEFGDGYYANIMNRKRSDSNE